MCLLSSAVLLLLCPTVQLQPAPERSEEEEETRWPRMVQEGDFGDGAGDWVGLMAVGVTPVPDSERDPRVLTGASSSQAGVEAGATPAEDSLVSQSSGLTLYLPPSALGQLQTQSFPPPQAGSNNIVYHPRLSSGVGICRSYLSYLSLVNRTCSQSTVAVLL